MRDVKSSFFMVDSEYAVSSVVRTGGGINPTSARETSRPQDQERSWPERLHAAP